MRDDVTCRGSLMLGTGCGRCVRCEEERQRINGKVKAAAVAREHPQSELIVPEAEDLIGWGGFAVYMSMTGLNWRTGPGARSCIVTIGPPEGPRVELELVSGSKIRLKRP